MRLKMIKYRTDLKNIIPEQMSGFFVGWPTPPSPATLFRILRSSYAKIIAVDTESQKAVGFITAISDGVLSAHIPLLEVLPEYQGHGIGSELVSPDPGRVAPAWPPRGRYSAALSCGYTLGRSPW